MKKYDTENLKDLIYVLAINEHKLEQFKKVMDVTIHCTSDSGCTIDTELYAKEGIIRYIIKGTRASMTVSFKTDFSLARKPRGAKPYVVWYNSYFMTDILTEIKKVVDSINKVW